MFVDLEIEASKDNQGVQYNSKLVNTHRILAEQQDKTDDFIQNGLHLLMTAFTDGRECHKTGMSVPPVRCATNKTNIKISKDTQQGIT